MGISTVRSLQIFVFVLILSAHSSLPAAPLVLKGGLGAGPTHTLIRVALPVFRKQLEEYSKGELTVTNYGVEVVTIQMVPDALRSGLIDFGSVFPYEPAIFPNFAMLLELGPMGTNGLAKAAATMEFIVTCEDCLKEFTRSGSVYAGGGSTWGTDLFTVTQPIVSAADFRGKRLRNPGGYGTTFTEFMGAVPVQTPFSEEFATLQSGVVDGTIAPAENLIGGRLFEIVRFRTPLDLGTYHTTGNFNVRNETWAKLSVSQREAWIRASLMASLAMTVRFKSSGDEGLIEMSDHGGISVNPSPDLRDAVERFRTISKEKAIELGTQRYGLADAEEKVRRFEGLYSEWEKRIATLDDKDYDAIATVIWEKVWSPIDLSAYGLE